jgi:type I restriction enzyme S subunit
MQTISQTYLKLIPFAEVNLWDVKRYYTKNNLQFENVVTLRDVLIPYKKAVSKVEMIENKWQIISKINFGGELFLRKFEEIYSYKGNVTLVPENAIIYSKINVRHGCIYFHEEGQTPFGVSSEYPTFKFDEKKINGKFLHKVLRSSAFKKLLNSKTTGISKARVKKDEFLDIEIPLPSISEQERLVNNYYKKITEIEGLEKSANNLEGEIEKYFLEQLGLKPFSIKEKLTSLQTTDYVSLDRWDFFSTDTRIAIELRKSKFELSSIGKSFQFAKRSFNKAQYKKETFKYIEIGAIDPTKGILEAKEIEVKKAPSRATQIVKEGDLIIGTTRPYLKKFAIVTNEYDSDICSSGFSIIGQSANYHLPFLHQFLKCTYGIEQLKNRMTGGLYPAITEPELKEIKIPFPKVETQKEIMTLIDHKKENILNNKELIVSIKEKAEQEFEKAIFS